MKRALLLFILLFTNQGFSQTSVYHHFPDSSASWNIKFFANFWMYVCDHDYSLVITDDTLINNFTYHKLNKPYVQDNSTGGPCLSNLPGYQGALREDTLLRLVYFIPVGDTSEQLLYDFNLAVGDTLDGFLETSLIGGPDVVYSVDSILIDNNYRKIWQINSLPMFYIIEGIGSTIGVIQPSFGSGVVVEGGWSTMCFRQNDIPLYSSSGLNSCEIITGISDQVDFHNFSIHPNPAWNTTIVDFGENKVEKVIIYTAAGFHVKTLDAQNLTQLEISGLKSGIYILRSYFIDGGFINMRLVIL